MSIWWKLDGKIPVPASDDLEAWKQETHLAKTEWELNTGETVLLSTVFLRLDHSWEENKTILFETMLFFSSTGWAEQDMERYETYDEAVQGHLKMKQKFEEFMNNEKIVATITSEYIHYDGIPD